MYWQSNTDAAFAEVDRVRETHRTDQLRSGWLRITLDVER